MKKLFALVIISNLFFLHLFSNNNLFRCGFEDIENTIHILQKKIKYIEFILDKFDLFICKQQQTIEKRNYFFNDFIEYVNFLELNNVRKICISSAKFRFYKWLYSVCQKFRRMCRALERHRCFINKEMNIACLDEKLLWLNQINDKLNNNFWNSSEFVSTNGLTSEIENLIEKINFSKCLYNKLITLSEEVENEIISLRTKVKNQMCDINLRCCCWL